MSGFGIPGLLEQWKSSWLDPALDYIEGSKLKTDSHLNQASNEYFEEEIKASTRNFDPSCLLGSGTFGSVYRGTMKDGTEVAIKVLQVPEEAGFEEEIKVLSRFRHPNLVILMGFARHAATGWRSLIYEFLAGGDVTRRIQRSRNHNEPFEWRARLSACLDAACGLSHLHNMTPRAFHRDIKGPNILLDKNGTAKMADFGLSCVSAGAQHKVQQASGTVGYACPEYIRTGIITEGSEVHSFGMVVLEVLTGAPPAVAKPNTPGEFSYLVDHIRGSKTKVAQMLDSTGNFPQSVSQAMTDVAFRCIQPVPAERPLFKLLVEELRELHLSSAALVTDSTTNGGSTATGAHQDQAQGLPRESREREKPQVRRVVLSAGLAVLSRYRGSGVWLRGQILKDNGNGTFQIQYDSGEIELNVLSANLRLERTEVPATPAGWRVARPELEGQSQLGQLSQLPPQPVPQPAPQPLQPVQLNAGPPPPPPPPQGRIGAAPAPQWAAAAAPAAAAQAPAGIGLTPAPRPKAPAPPNPERSADAEKDWPTLGVDGGDASGNQEILDPSVVPPYHFWCIYAEGVDLATLTSEQRAVPGSGSAESIFGRTAQPNAVWETLVPNRFNHSTISREHLKVIARSSSKHLGVPQVSFGITCLSQNSIFLNGQHMDRSTGEHPLQHGDVLSLAAHPVSSGDGQGQKKVFVVFQFEVLGPSPAAAALPTIRPSDDCDVQEEPMQLQPAKGPFDVLHSQEELQRPPNGTVAGRWRTSASAPAPSDALYALEVHGDEVREWLPAEERQLFGCEPASEAASPWLRVGRFYQRGLWERILTDEVLKGGTLWGSIMAQDHFEILAVRKNNPRSSEPPDYCFRLRVLSAAGVTLNYSMVCTSGDERELGPSDTLTLRRPVARGTPSQPVRENGSDGQHLKGFHMTFIPLVGPLSKQRSESETEFASFLEPEPGERPQLPELSDSENEGSGHGRPGGSASLLASAYPRAGALRPPTDVLPINSESFDEVNPFVAPRPLGSSYTHSKQELVGTRILEPRPAKDNESVEPDDLFARTGFRQDGVPPNEDVGKLLSAEAASDGYPARKGSWLTSFSC